MSDEDFQNGQGGQDDAGAGNGNADFSIPSEYQDKGWTKFFDGKTGDELKTELFRSYDNSQTLIGKKVEDYLASTDLKNLENYEAIREALIKQIAPDTQVPENAEGYSFNDILKDENGELQYEYPEEALGYFGDVFKEAGLSKEQGQKILKSYTDFELKQFQKFTNADELENDIRAMFGEKSADKSELRKTVESLLREFVPQEEQKYLQQTAPNYTIEMFYKVAKGLVDKYGYKEGTSAGNNPTKIRMTEAERNEEYDRLCKQLEDYDNNPHQKPGERDAIVGRMKELFK